MALNATVGASDANSYVTLAEANAYFADRVHSSAWGLFPEKENVLMSSSQMLDWYMNWKGKKATTTQSMQFPRTGVVRPDGTEVDSTIIPTEVKVATYELALSSLSSDRTVDSDLAGIEQIKAGSLMVKADSGDMDSTAKKVIPDKVKNILSDLITSGRAGVVRLIRG